MESPQQWERVYAVGLDGGPVYALERPAGSPDSPCPYRGFSGWADLLEHWVASGVDLLAPGFADRRPLPPGWRISRRERTPA